MLSAGTEKSGMHFWNAVAAIFSAIGNSALATKSAGNLGSQDFSRELENFPFNIPINGHPGGWRFGGAVEDYETIKVLAPCAFREVLPPSPPCTH